VTLRGAVGETRALVLLVEFADTTFDAVSHPPAHFDSLLFGRATTSVREFYDEISLSTYSLVGDVHGLVRLNKPIRTYTGQGQCDGCFLGIGDYPYNSQRLVEDLVSLVNPGIDFGLYDGDGDGIVDLLFVVHSGAAYEDTGDPRLFQSHQWHTVNEPTPDGVRVSSYVFMSEWSGLGGFAHEMGHLFGAPDLYDLGTQGEGLGDWSLMARGARLGQPMDSNPAHPDPWTRCLFGFADPVTDPIDGLDGTVALRPVESGGRILKLWREKRPGTEYFLLEHRRRDAGTFDQALPGEGLLIYHVDDTVPTNNNQFRYHVAVEQADGLFDLEVGNGNTGDGGDPYPGSTGNTRFDSTSAPDSRRYDGDPSGVSVTGIAEGVDEIVFDLALADGPGLEIVATDLRELVGNGDLRPEAGEQWSLDIVIENRGLDSGATALTPRPGRDGITIEPASLQIDAMPTGAIESHAGVFALSISDTIRTDPFEIPIRFVFSEEGEADSSNVVLVGGTVFGADQSFDSGQGNWFHHRVGFGAVDPWHRSTARASDGSHAMKCGDASGQDYPDSIDAVLVSPPLLLGAGSVLRWSDWMNAEEAPPSDAFDGGRIEISTDKQTWSVVEPEGGYTHQPIANATFDLFDHPLFSGYSGGWRDLSADLSAYDGKTVWVRFRFASNRDAYGDGRLFEGWYVDDIRLETNGDDVAFHLFTPSDVDGKVTLRLSLVENVRPFDGVVVADRTRVDGGGAPLGASVHLGEWSVSGDTLLTVVDEGPLIGEFNRYRILSRESGTEVERATRTIFITRSHGPAVVVSAGPHPFVPASSPFRIVVDPAGRTSPVCTIYDLAGRRVARLAGRSGGGGLVVMEWNGRDESGRRNSSGVYFYRLDGSIGRVTLLR